MWAASHSRSSSVRSFEQDDHGGHHRMANEPIFSHRCAVPAPLRISPKPPSSSSSSSDPGRPQASPDPRATPCNLRSRLPGQPVFDPAPAEGFKPDSLRAANSKCSCPKSPASPMPSPLSPRLQGSAVPVFPGGFSASSSRRSSTTTTASRGPSLDFSSLFMRSETLRHELETCACHQGDAPRSAVGCPVLPAAGSDRSFRRDSVSSGYTSCYSN
ncbi:hypothetical protein KVR01_007353 [Diaporthe batatas]|uniref:uncharacterized protein n=1 Tax=Diaporthe batatas TaxID=748121 RepID=UPI001D056559|nr:uncharacterized protein KVR01_007353 [Diaporthe batatas]KAG8162875.1 hypothetical protein KVR01_007353 [Diaporthe batatas]